MAKPRVIITPALETDLAEGKSALVYWKEILPRAAINYTDPSGRTRVINFDERYHRDVKMAFDQKAIDQTPFVLADKDNAHTMDPERFRAEAVEMRDFSELPPDVKAQVGDRTGSLFAKLRFADEESAKAVTMNPRLGVSVRLREGYQRAIDKKTFRAVAVHILGTLDQKLAGAGMSGWTPALDFSLYDSGNVLDLSKTGYSEDSVAKKKADAPVEPPTFDIEATTEDDIEAMTDDELEAFLAQLDALAVGPGDPGDDDGDPGDGDPDEGDEPSTYQAPAPGQLQEATLSNAQIRDIELANSVAQAAESRANEALRRMAAAEWAAASADYLRQGVPPHLLDLAEPVLNRPDEFVVDLSNSGDGDVNVSEIVRGFLDAAKGQIDLATEVGHIGSTGVGDDDPDKAMLDAWDAQYS